MLAEENYYGLLVASAQTANEIHLKNFNVLIPFKKGGKGLRQSMQMMMNTIKTTHVLPLQWSQMGIFRQLKRKRVL